MTAAGQAAYEAWRGDDFAAGSAPPWADLGPLDRAAWEAAAQAAVAAQQPQPAPGAQCGTCDGSGMLTVPDGDGESASEQACPDPVHDGDDWFEVGDADAGTQPAPELAAAMAEARTLRTDLDEATRVMLAHHDGAVQRRGRALRKRAGLEEL